MPYLRMTCPPLDEGRKRQVAEALTTAINDLFFNPRGRLSREELRERTTVHFFPYADGDLYIGGKTPAQRGHPDVTIELSDWSMSVRQQRKVAAELTPHVAAWFDVPHEALDHVNIRFHSYPPTDFAVGGKLLSDLIPLIGRVMKRFFG